PGKLDGISNHLRSTPTREVLVPDGDGPVQRRAALSTLGSADRESHFKGTQQLGPVHARRKKGRDAALNLWGMVMSGERSRPVKRGPLANCATMSTRADVALSRAGYSAPLGSSAQPRRVNLNSANKDPTIRPATKPIEITIFNHVGPAQTKSVHGERFGPASH